MKDKPQGGPVTRARIGTLRLRVPAESVGSAKALAAAVASRLARRAGELGGVAAGETVRVRVRASAPMSSERLAETIAGKVLEPASGKRGRR
jgi:hypothetical protein